MGVGPLARGTTPATVALSVAGALCLSIPLALVAAYTLNVFYGTGAIFWDMGLFAHLVTFSDAWPMSWPDFFHHGPGPRETFFSIHFMPMLYLTSALHKLVPFLPPAAWFSLLQSLWTGIIGLSVFMLCARSATDLRAIAAALATALCGPILAMASFPHIELAIPAFFLLFVWLRAARWPIAAYAAILLCFAVREDAGFHVAGFLLLLALAQGLSGSAASQVRETLWVAALGLAYSLTALAIQALGFPSAHGHDQLAHMYLGTPAFAHVTAELVYQRCVVLLIDRAYVLWPLLVMAAIAVWKRNLVLLAGAVAPLPWIILHVVAIGDQGLGGHYAFPLIIALAWPAAALGSQGVGLQVIMSTLSIGLFAISSGALLDRAPWNSVGLPDFHAIGLYERELGHATSQRGTVGRLVLDDAVVSLVPELAAPHEWAVQWAADKVPDPDVVIYLPGARDKAFIKALLVRLDLRHRCKLGKTPFVVASRSGTLLCR